MFNAYVVIFYTQLTMLRCSFVTIKRHIRWVNLIVKVTICQFVLNSQKQYFTDLDKSRWLLILSLQSVVASCYLVSGNKQQTVKNVINMFKSFRSFFYGTDRLVRVDLRQRKASVTVYVCAHWTVINQWSMAAIVQLINEPLIIVLIRGLRWTLRPWMSTEGEQMDSPYVGEVLNSLSLSCSLYFSLSHTDTNSAHENVCGGTCERVGFSFFLFISFPLVY